MFAFFTSARKAAARLTACVALLWLAACSIPTTLTPTQDNGPRIDPSAPVQVALLVPGAAGISSNLENAARMAIADLRGARIDMRVYNTGGNPVQAAQVANAAVDDGAQIILGPLFGEAANAAGVAVANRNVNVLAFSNNPTTRAILLLTCRSF